MTQQRRSQAQRRQPNQVHLRYIKSTIAPVLHADGVFGGVTPRGLIYLAFFSEHAGIPNRATLEVDTVKKSVQEVQPPTGETEMVREVGAEIIITVEFARSLQRWLGDKISAIEGLRPEDSFTATELEQQP